MSLFGGIPLDTTTAPAQKRSAFGGVPVDSTDAVPAQSPSPASESAPGYDWNPVSPQNLREVAKGARPVLNGALALPSMLADAAGAVVGTPPSGNRGEAIADIAGLPVPENNFDRLAGSIAEGATGAMTGVGLGNLLSKAASPVVSGVGNLMKSQPVLQSAGGATGGFAGEVAREDGAGPEGQIAASVAGGLVPFANPATLLRAPIQAMAGGGDKMRTRIAEFLKAGDSPTVAQATQNPTMTWLENLLADAPGANIVMRNKGRQQATNIGNTLDAQAGKLAPGATKMEVGQKISEDMSSKRAQNSTDQNALYQKFFDLLPEGRNTRIDVPQFRAALDELTKLEPGAPAMSEGNVHPAIAKLKQDFLSDSGGGPLPLPYDTIRAIKTRLNEALNFDAATKPVSGQQVSRLTGAMSEDLKAAASSASPESRVALDEANAFTSQMHKDYSALTGVVQKAAGGDFGAVYNAATAGSRDGNRMIEVIKRQLDPNGKKMLASFFVRQLARGTNATRIADEAADSVGETTSVQSLLKNWNALSPEAKKSFTNAGDFGSEWSGHMDALSKVASNIATGAKQYANPSNSAGRGATYAFLAAMAGAAASGSPGKAMAIGTTFGAVPTGIAALLTNRRVVQFLAKTINKPAGAVPVLLNQLSVQSQRTNDSDLQKLHDLLRTNLANPTQPATPQP